jgi:hypothetical protein
MFDPAVYAAHLARWDGALERRPMTWLDRWLVRRSLRRRYRALGLGAPRGVFVSSPHAAAIAAGVAAGVRWLQRNPDTHGALFGGPLDAATLADAVAATVAEVTRALICAPAPGPIIAAIREVTAGLPARLPGFARAVAFPTEAVEAAPSLAADDGVVDARLLVAPLQRFTDCSPPYQVTRRPPLAALPQAIDEALGRLRCPSTFLGRALSAWLRCRVAYARQVSAATIASFVRGPRVQRETLDALRVMHRAGPVFAHADFWIAADRPRETARDEAGRRHNLNRPAVVWRDGAGLGFVHGVHVDLAVFRRRPTLPDVLAAMNIELRRVLIQLYERDDQGAFIRDADADVIALDYDRHGNQRQLLRFPLPGDEPYVAVQVINSTPEPDGSHKRYLLRVPPTITSCRAAVAWTFGMAADDYDPDVET